MKYLISLFVAVCKICKNIYFTELTKKKYDDINVNLKVLTFNITGDEC